MKKILRLIQVVLLCVCSCLVAAHGAEGPKNEKVAQEESTLTVHKMLEKFDDKNMVLVGQGEVQNEIHANVLILKTILSKHQNDFNKTEYPPNKHIGVAWAPAINVSVVFRRDWWSVCIFTGWTRWKKVRCNPLKKGT